MSSSKTGKNGKVPRSYKVAETSATSSTGRTQKSRAKVPIPEEGGGELETFLTEQEACQRNQEHGERRTAGETEVSEDKEVNEATQLQREGGSGKVDAVVGLDARGFLIGPILALRLGAAFVPVRKSGKLPGQCVQAVYEKEYGTVSTFVVSL